MIKIYFYPLLLLMIVVSACSGFAFSPERAATQELIEYNAAIADSIRIHQSQPWQGKVVVLASYLSNEGGEMASCEAVFQMERTAGSWHVGGSGIGCSVPPNTEPVSFGSGTQGVAPDDLSYAHGLVTLNAAEVVEVTWQDGAVQKAQVVNGSFLALREGTFHMIARIEVFDKDHSMIYEIEIMPDTEKIP